MTPRFSMSKIREFVTCEQRFKYRYVDRIQPMAYQRALEFGGMGHTLLEKYYESRVLGKPFYMQDTLKKLREDRENIGFTAGTAQAFETDLFALEGMIVAYIANYQKQEQADEWEIVDIEKRFTSKNIVPDYMAEGIVDLIIRIKGQLWILDHKFQSRIDEGYIRKMPMDHQVHMYKRLVEDNLNEPVRGFIYNIVRKPTKRLKRNQSQREYMMEVMQDYSNNPGHYFFRQPVIVTSEHMHNFDLFLVRVMRDMERSYKDNSFRRNIYECDKMGICPFLELCLDGDNARHLYKDITYGGRTHTTRKGSGSTTGDSTTQVNPNSNPKPAA